MIGVIKGDTRSSDYSSHGVSKYQFLGAPTRRIRFSDTRIRARQPISEH